MTMSNGDRNFMFDYFLDFCHLHGLDSDAVDFDSWAENQIDQAIDEALWG